MQSTAKNALLLAACAGLAGCGGGDAKGHDKATGGAAAKPVGTPTASTEDTDLGVKPLAYGPYLAADLAPAGAEAGFEFGTIYMRKQNYVGGGAGIKDYIWVQATAFGTSGFLPKKAATGCGVPAAAQPAKSDATGVVLSGQLTDTLPVAGTLFQYQDVKGEKVIDSDATLTANVTLPAGQVAVAASPVPSADSILRFSGAFDYNFNTNMAVQDINTNLSQAKNDLKITFTKKTERENLAIVTFYGGAAAPTKVYRCYVAANGNVVIPASAYKGLLPVRGVIGVFANVVAKTEGGTTTWSSTLSGSGIIDQAVP